MCASGLSGETRSKRHGLDAQGQVGRVSLESHLEVGDERVCDWQERAYNCGGEAREPPDVSPTQPGVPKPSHCNEMQRRATRAHVERLASRRLAFTFDTSRNARTRGGAPNRGDVAVNSGGEPRRSSPAVNCRNVRSGLRHVNHGCRSKGAGVGHIMSADACALALSLGSFRVLCCPVRLARTTSHKWPAAPSSALCMRRAVPSTS